MSPAVMRPFKTLARLDEARQVLLGAVTPVVDVESVAIADAGGRVLARDVRSPLDVPGFDRSAMDGFAVKARDTFGATKAQPRVLDVVGVVHAGDVHPGVVSDGEAVRIATGGRIPAGADAVVRVEDTADGDGGVRILAAVPPGTNVSRRGGDVRTGETVLAAGAELTPARVGLLASLGLAHVDAYRLPRVVVAPTGNEVVEPGRELPDGHVYNSNAYALEALFRANGATVRRASVTGDTTEALAAVLDGPGADADLVVFTGGSSVGERDVLVDVVRAHGDVLVHGVQVKPGKPLLVGRSGKRVIVGLPGNPASCLTNAYLFCLPAIRAIGRRPPAHARVVRAPLAETVTSRLGRYQVLPVRIDANGRAVPTFKESGHLTSLSASDGFVGIADNVETVDEGTPVEVHLW